MTGGVKLPSSPMTAALTQGETMQTMSKQDTITLTKPQASELFSLVWKLYTTAPADNPEEQFRRSRMLELIVKKMNA